MGQCACPAAAGASDAQHAAAVFAAGYNLCRIYAGNAAYSAYRFHHDEACEYRKEFRTAAATVSAYAAVLCAVSLGYRAGSSSVGQAQKHPAMAKTSLLYRLQASDFNRKENMDAEELQKLSLEQLWELFPIVIRPHNEQYAAWYDAQRLHLQELLKASIVRISHIGSTVVKGLEAKPCVDILLETDTRHPQELIKRLTQDGWILMSRKQEEQGDILCFNKGYTALGFAQKVYHLHVRYPAAWGELYFCDYLRAHDEACREYAALKKELAQTYRKDRDAYTHAKTQFIEEMTKRARRELSDKFSITAENK